MNANSSRSQERDIKVYNDMKYVYIKSMNMKKIHIYVQNTHTQNEEDLYINI